jgi:hypothetical protein
MKRILWAFGVLEGALLAYAGCARWGGAQTPVGQLSLTDLDRGGLPVFEQMFDDAGGRVRVVGLFSPT